MAEMRRMCVPAYTLLALNVDDDDDVVVGCRQQKRESSTFSCGGKELTHT
jgi:hypothetical protein